MSDATVGDSRLLVVGRGHAEHLAVIESVADRHDGVDVAVVDKLEAARDRLESERVACLFVSRDAMDGSGGLEELLGDGVDAPVVFVDGADPDEVRSIARSYAEGSRRTALFESLVDAMPMPTLVVSGDREVEYANEHAADLVDASGSASLEGEDPLSYVPADERETAAERMASVIREGETRTSRNEYRIQADAEVKHVLSTGVPVTYGGQPSALVLLNDVSDRVRQSRTLRRERDRFVTLFEHLPNPVIHAVVEDGRPVVRNVNDAFEETFGSTAGDVRGEPLAPFVAPEDRDVDDEVEPALLAGRYSADVTRATPTCEREFAVNVVLREVEDGSRREGYATFTDITDQKRREERLRRQNDRLEEFASIVSHDLRNPLSVAGGYLELLADEYDDERVGKVQTALDRMDALIEKVLTMARQGQVVDDPEPIDVAEHATRCWTNVSSPAASLEVEDPLTVVADEQGLSQLLENLFRNAVEHGGEDVTVRVGTLDGDGPATDGFYLADDGPGIPPEDRADVFESGYSTDGDGTGLGLNIVEQIAEAHGWSVSLAESETGGARFEFAGVDVR